MTSTTPEHCPYRRLGTGRSPLIALHGLGGSSVQPISLLAEQALRGFDVIAVDMRAHGRNDLPVAGTAMSIASLADDVMELLATLQVRQDAVLLGISMGAAVTVELLARGYRPAAAILVRPAWLWSPCPPNLDAFGAIGRLLGDHPPDVGRRLFTESDHYGRIAEVSVAAAEAVLGQFDDPRAVERRARLLQLPGSAPTRPARSVRGPESLVVVGCDRDPIHPLTLADELAEDVDAEFVRIPSRYDDPDGHVSALNDILMGIGQGRPAR